MGPHFHSCQTMQFKVVVFLAFFITVNAETSLHQKDSERDGGLLGFGLLGGGETTTAAADATTASSDGLAGPIQGLLDLLTGVTSTLPIVDIASLMGINTDPVPSPFSDPLGFVMHPLITPIILAAVTLNVPALALAQGALAGNLIITHLLMQQQA